MNGGNAKATKEPETLDPTLAMGRRFDPLQRHDLGRPNGAGASPVLDRGLSVPMKEVQLGVRSDDSRSSVYRAILRWSIEVFPIFSSGI